MRLALLVGSTALTACASTPAPPPAPVGSGAASYPSGPAATVPCPSLERLTGFFAKAFPETPARATECYELHRGEPLWLVVGTRDAGPDAVGETWPAAAVLAADDQAVLATERSEAWVGVEDSGYAIADLDGDGADEILLDHEETSRHGVEHGLFVLGVGAGTFTDLGNVYLGGRGRYESDEEPPVCTGRWTIEPSAMTPGPKRLVVTREGPGCEEPGAFTFVLRAGRLTPP